MTHVLRFCLFLLTALSLHAQGFTIDVSPKRLTVEPKRNAVFTITTTTTGGFGASIFIKATAPTLNPAAIIVDPSTLNAPYTTLTTVTIVPAAGEVGTHTIVVEARNGDVASYDTVVLTVTPAPGADRWTVYSPANSGLPSKIVTAIGIQKSGVAWIGTDAGLARAMPGEAPQAFSSVEASGPIGAIGIDSADGVWVAGGRGIARYHNGEWTGYPIPSGLLPSGSVFRSIAAAPDGSIWFGGSNGLLRLRDNVWKRFTTEDWGNIIPSSIAHVVVTRKGDLWASVYSNQAAGKGILKFDGSFWTAISLVPSGLHDHSSGAALAVDVSDRIWVLTYDGLAIVDGTTLIRQPTNFRSSLIAIDRTGRLWVGSSWGGDPEALFSQQSGPWAAHPVLDAGLQTGTMISSLAIHPDGTVWAGTYLHGLVILGPGAGTSSVADGAHAGRSERVSVSPHPLRSEGSLAFMTRGGSARITLHDNVGREVARLFEGVIPAGGWSLPIALTDIPDGVYLLRVVVDGETPSSRVVVVSR